MPMVLTEAVFEPLLKAPRRQGLLVDDWLCWPSAERLVRIREDCFPGPTASIIRGFVAVVDHPAFGKL